MSPLSSAPSLRLAYKDLEQQRKIEEEKLKGLDGKKKAQAERLGMGLGARRCEDVKRLSRKNVQFSLSISHTLTFTFCLCSGVSHSVTSDMQIIQQEKPKGAKTSKLRRFSEDEDEDDDDDGRRFFTK